jgi:hypothetical protein
MEAVVGFQADPSSLAQANDEVNEILAANS